MRKLLTIAALLFYSICFAQLENANWCFRNYARLNFTPTSVTASTCASGAPMNNPGTSASVSDASGNLLFYSSGGSVWDRNDNVMPNGTGLSSCQGGYTLQSTLIVPKPNSATIYYIFTINQGCHDAGYYGFFYSVVDMCLNNGNGDIVPGKKNIPLLNHQGDPIQSDDYNHTERSILEARLTSTHNNDDTKIWVTFLVRFGQTSGYLSDRYAYNYLVSDNGINGVPDGTSAGPATYISLSPANFPVPIDWSLYGYAKFSPNGSYFCDANGAAVTLYQFNNTTGALQNPVNLYTSGSFPYTHQSGMGLEFSPNSQLLYFTTYESELYQGKGGGGGGGPHNVTRIRQSDFNPNFPAIVIAETETGNLASLQLAINGQIYVCASAPGYPVNNMLGRIQDPNVPGINCNFIQNGQQLAPGTRHEGFFPQWVHKTIYTPTNNCNTPSYWPKVYESAESNGITIDNYGNIYSAMSMTNMSNNLNHNGPTYSGPGDIYVHYNAGTGVTNWIGTDWSCGLPLGNGNINFRSSSGTNSYRNGNTGAPAIGPNVPSNMELLAEDNGGYIVKDGYNLRSYDPAGNLISTIPIAIVPNYFLDGTTRAAIYHPGNHKLFICYMYYNGFLGYHLRIAVINFNPTNHSMTAANIPANNQVHGIMVQVNNNEQIYIYNWNTQQLEEYNLNGTYTPLSMANFSNSSLEEIGRNNYLVEDRILVKNTNLHYFYCVNTVTNISKKISYTPPSTMSQFYSWYSFYGNNVFISGQFEGTGFSIGSQSMPLLGSYSSFLTKFNVNADFNRSDGSDLFAKGNKDISPMNVSLRPVLNFSNETLQLFPNPAGQILQVVVNDGNTKGTQAYSISIINTAGARVFSTFSNNNLNTLDISRLRPGMYYLTISTNSKIIASKAFLKK